MWMFVVNGSKRGYNLLRKRGRLWKLVSNMDNLRIFESWLSLWDGYGWREEIKWDFLVVEFLCFLVILVV